MIKANELRIGNWVENENGHPILVNANFFAMLERLGGKSTGTRGIPLTPEILEMCKSTLQNNGFEHEWVRGRLNVTISSICITTVDYLHEYQNLYFALLGSELGINHPSMT